MLKDGFGLIVKSIFWYFLAFFCIFWYFFVFSSEGFCQFFLSFQGVTRYGARIFAFLPPIEAFVLFLFTISAGRDG